MLSKNEICKILSCENRANFQVLSLGEKEVILSSIFLQEIKLPNGWRRNILSHQLYNDNGDSAVIIYYVG